MKCPFCNAKLYEEMLNSVYGCDTGCEYVRIEIKCQNCNKIVWNSGTFGDYDDEESRQEYREEFMEEFSKHLEKLMQEKTAGGL